ncbi:MAG TPA: response regulator [Hyphomicrobium sp.]|nr:response regulator [Hyphomonadaceae bacterium]HPG88854.1 response regulator [Hyphomicrobium sp.]HPN06182.1 response regulator [Hyphomonadaceae bacterium]
MKVLWVEDHARAGELLAAAGAAASRKRFGIDLVIATSLMDAERKLRLERFDLVVIDLMLPDSADEDATVTRIASMGKFRVAVVSGSDKRDEVVRSLTRAGVDCSPNAVGKENLPLADFVRRPELFRDFIQSLMPQAGPAKAAG